jgi:predicted nucleic acid-binding protein
MIRRILDTSVAAAWYLPERFSGEARRWQQRLLDGQAELLTPSLHYWEFANVLRTYLRRGELHEELAREIYELHLEAPITVVEPARSSVLEVALQYEATAYDAVYIALSIEQDIPLLVAERPSTPWVRKLGKLADCMLHQAK